MFWHIANNGKIVGEMKRRGETGINLHNDDIHNRFTTDSQHKWDRNDKNINKQNEFDARQIVNLHTEIIITIWLWMFIVGARRLPTRDRSYGLVPLPRAAYYNKTYLISFKSVFWLSGNISTSTRRRQRRSTNSRTMLLMDCHHQILFMDKLSLRFQSCFKMPAQMTLVLQKLSSQLTFRLISL